MANLDRIGSPRFTPTLAFATYDHMRCYPTFRNMSTMWQSLKHRRSMLTSRILNSTMLSLWISLVRSLSWDLAANGGEVLGKNMGEKVKSRQLVNIRVGAPPRPTREHTSPKTETWRTPSGQDPCTDLYGTVPLQTQTHATIRRISERVICLPAPQLRISRPSDSCRLATAARPAAASSHHITIRATLKSTCADHRRPQNVYTKGGDAIKKCIVLFCRSERSELRRYRIYISALTYLFIK